MQTQKKCIMLVLKGWLQCPQSFGATRYNYPDSAATTSGYFYGVNEMSKYTPATFQPTVRPDWAGILSYLADKEKAEILEALFKYPSEFSEKCQSAFWKETIKPDLDLQYQTFTKSCKEKSRGVRNRWEKISISDGKDIYNTSISDVIDTERERESKRKSEEERKGEEERKSEEERKGEEKVVQPTEQEVVEYAKQMNDAAGMSGFKCTEQQALLFYAYFDKEGWKDKDGVPVKDWKKAFKYWVRRDEQYGYSKKSASNDKEVEEFIAVWNEMVYKSLKSVSVWADVIEATMENSKDRFSLAKTELTKLIAEVKKKQAEGKKPFLGITVPFDNIWVFAAEIFCKRRFYSSFLYHECKTTPAFFLKNIKTLADPYSDEYLDDSQKWYHD